MILSVFRFDIVNGTVSISEQFLGKIFEAAEILTVEMFLIKNVGTQYTFSLHLSLGLVLFYFTFELLIILDSGF